MKTLYFDCFCGASGDMIVGALLDAGGDFEALSAALSSLGVGGFKLSAEKVNKKGIQATQFTVHVDDHHDHPHRHLRHVLEIIDQGNLPQAVKDAAAETFRRIAECEAAIHGTTPEKVHFHEVGAVDSIVDIVGAHWLLNSLGIERVESSHLHVGFGTIEAAHGVMPVPAPATARLLMGVPTYAGDVEAELVTPTGAAIVTQLSGRYGPTPALQVEAIGYGSGQRDLDDRANVLRVLIGEGQAALPKSDPITVVEANIDDMNPELLPALVADVIAQGARDAFLTPILGKKGRPAYLVTVLCEDNVLGDILQAVFNGSTTLGVRIRREERICLERSWKIARTPWGDVRVKLGVFQGATTCASPEYEECRRVAEEGGAPVSRVYEAARAAAVRGELVDD